MSGRMPDSRPDYRTTERTFDCREFGLHNMEFSCPAVSIQPYRHCGLHSPFQATF